MSLAVSPLFCASPFAGRWDFTGGVQDSRWLGVTEKGANLDVWYQPTGGHVEQVKDLKVAGNHMTFKLGDAEVTLDLAGDKLTGTEKGKTKSVAITGVRAPELKGKAPKAWSAPESLFNGKDLTGWTPMGDASKSKWVVKDGTLLNEDHGANIMTTRKFTDFKLHFEVFCPDHANSGFYLRGRYEIQLEKGNEGNAPPNRLMGAVYGRLEPAAQAPKKGDYDVFDVTLVGRTVTIVRNGVTTVNAKEIEGITGGALDANEGEPGPFYIQGDHTGGLKFRNITVSVPK